MIDPTELDSRGRALLEHYQGAQAPSAEVSTRVWEAVSARAAAGELGPDLSEAGASTSPAPSPASNSALGLTAKIALGVGAAVVVAALAVGLGAPRNEPEAPEGGASTVPAPSHDRRGPDPAPEDHGGAPGPSEVDAERAPAHIAPSKVETESAPSGEDEARARSETDTPPPNASARRRHAADGENRSPTDAAASSASKRAEPVGALDPEVGPDLGPEVALMTKARAAMRAGRHAEALGLLDEHARSFPRGVFSNERELSRVTILCGMNEQDAANEAARRYLKRRPSARERLAKTCAGDGL